MTNTNAKTQKKQAYTTTSDMYSDCQNHMAKNRLALDSALVVNTDKFQRYSIDRKRNQPDEWYIAWDGVSIRGNPYLSCVYGSWSDNSRFDFKSWEHGEFKSKVDDEERKALHESFKKRREEVNKLLEEEREFAAKEAEKIWNSASTEPQNEIQLRYVKKKGIQSVGARFGKNPRRYNAIIIPLMNIEEEIRSLQFISVSDDGNVYKRFFSGGEKKGNFFQLGEIKNGERFHVSEGYSTGASVYEATNEPVIVAFDSGNLSSVVQNLRKKYPENEIIIAGDNDENNVGQEKANEAAKMYECKVSLPSFPKGKELDKKGNKHTDFNDLHQFCGIEEVKKQLENPKTIPTIQEELKCLASELLKKDEPCEGFSTSVLPQCLHEYISSIAETTNAHPIMITCAVLTMISSFVKKRIYISENDYFQTLYPNLWMLNITKSGGFKTTALNKGARLAREKAQKTYREVQEINKKLRAESSKEKKEKLEEEKLLASTKNPMLPGKITTEALLEHLGQGHAGMILISEFGAWQQNMEKNCNLDLKQIFTDLYDVPPFFHYKTKTAGDHFIEEPFISICGVSTLTWIKENLKPNDVSSGFFARFLLFTPPHNDDIPPARPVKSNTKISAFEDKIKDTLDYMDDSYEYKFNKCSGPYFDKLHDAIYQIPKQYSEKCQEILGPYLKRWSPYLLKLAMLIRLFEDPTSKELSNSALYAAMKILKVAIKSTAKLFEGELGESLQQKKFRLVFEWVCKRIEKGKPTKYKDIISSKVLEGGGPEYDYVLETLVHSGKLKKTGPETPKKEVLYVVEKQQVEKVEKS